MASRADQDQRVYSRSYLTKLRVAEAMDRLCAAMPFARVRIEDIVRESGVSRSNFYHNFSDKNAVVTWIAEQCHANGIFRIGRDLTWFEGHMITTRDMARFRTLFNSAAGSTEYAAAEPYFVRARQHNLVETLTDYQHRAIDEQLAFQIEAWPHCELVMAGKFRAGALPYGLKAFCNYLVAMTPRELYEALEHPVANAAPGELAELR
ncbi:TetR/AcrR family transcriptional regulator [Adlercreutzia faecimuris]|uniref:TetR/AcrR family transcriptional regulator n=1 Tax=Adlercreutzia faecimuris TaxID=2897341 RepID=A0ABS9WD62_9ACTN|nr:TetR/AcrR family transcriptional regulator [Adlercreutzia sp. JBNU-10]MCI2240783.1 TetR/AcrR family transcriptional regulator [Adlercreutzia sp. JBNU-10]